LVLALLAVGFEIFPFDGGEGELHAVDFFQGFGHEALVAVCALMIAGQGIVRTGALEPVGRAMARLWKISPGITFLITLLLAAFISAFINNVPVVVLFRKRQYNRIFFPAGAYVMMQHPKTIKEDAHDKTQQPGRPNTENKALASAYNSPTTKWSESCRILQTTSAFISCSDVLEQEAF
jgi:hypothetical protein